MKIIFLFAGIYIIISNAAFAQNSENTYAISGRTIEAQSGKPLSNVNVSIAYSQLGAATDDSGKFEINNIPVGNYKLIVSSIGYVTVVYDLQIINHSIGKLLFELKPKTYVLPTVNILDDDADEWRDNFNTFKEEFIGLTENSEHTRIEDPYIIEFAENDEGNLTASTEEPLVIYNNALGYKITYFLYNFVTTGITTQFAGLPVFEELKPIDDEEKNKWEINRKKTFLGSLRHFLKSICDIYDKPEAKLSKLGFEVKSQDKLKSTFPPKRITTKENLRPAENGNEVFLAFRNYWHIVYESPYKDSDYSSKYTNSYIKLHDDSVRIDKFGRYFEEFKIQTFGSWSSNRIADMLPFEYEVNENNFVREN